MEMQNTKGAMENTPYLKSCVLEKGLNHAIAAARLLAALFTFSGSSAITEDDSREDNAEDASVLIV